MEKIYEYFLTKIPGAGAAGTEELLNKFGDAEKVFEQRHTKEFMEIILPNKKEGARYDKLKDFIEKESLEGLEKEYAEMINNGIDFICLGDERYPKRLLDCRHPPYALFVKGELPKDDVPSVAIIGARNCSEYGTYIADAFGYALAKEGINIISGMARGIDGISQKGALKAGGRTFGVLGCGVDVCYPQGNYSLYKEMQKKGGIISTFIPGTQPLKANFPIRNEYVAALSDMVLVVEAKEKSGTSITVDLALKLGREVYAVPGRLTDRLSDGCNRLIRDGAGIALSPEDIIREMAVMWNRQEPDSDLLNQNLISKLPTNQPARDIGPMKYLDYNPKAIEDIVKAYKKDNPKVTPSQTMSELVLLCLEGKVCQVGTGYFYIPGVMQ